MPCLHIDTSLISYPPGLENSTRPLVFTSASGCRASEKFNISIENQIVPIYANSFCDAGQVPIFRYFEACPLVFNKLIYYSVRRQQYILKTAHIYLHDINSLHAGQFFMLLLLFVDLFKKN